MKRLINVIKECNTEDLFGYLTEGKTKKEEKKQFIRYYSLYCSIVESYSPNRDKELVITGYKRNKSNQGIPEYEFAGILNPTCQTKKEESILWTQVIVDKVDVVVPDILLEHVTDVFIVAEVFRKLELYNKEKIEKRYNEGLFQRVYRANRKKYSTLEAISRYVEKITYDNTVQKMIQNEVLEYCELKSGVKTWGELLHQEYSCFMEFVTLCLENPPNFRRAEKRIFELREAYRSTGLDAYINVYKNRCRIIIENQKSEFLPLIYVRDVSGNSYPLQHYSMNMLVCMDIRIQDNFLRRPESILALLLYYLEYPIRIDRIKKNDGITLLIQILKNRLEKQKE